MDITQLSPAAVRKQIREGQHTEPTAGLAKGYTQSNLAILKKSMLLIFYCFVNAIRNNAH